ncbi:MAG: DUF1778 domain-containing protein [Pirellulaceae bacterium]|jgi:uncharacterized protein (DUF1778 family)|nr:DUF1778 domain-containing protein [Pirellulaceae bacterium]
MPRVAVQDSSRVSLRIRPEDKALLVRAVSYTHTDLTAFVLQNAVQAAKAVIAEAEHVALSERDSLRVLSALEDPPPANAKLLAAARALPILPHLHLADGSAQAQV